MSPQHQLFEVPKMEPSPQWDCQKQIGAGGFAQVFLESITRPVFGTQLCAVKRIIKEDVKFPRKSYMQEINIFSKLNQNDWFVQFFASHEDSQHIYIAMEYIAWGDLGKYIDFGWDERDAAIVAHQLLCGLQYLHQKGITHRDLKPANIFPVPQTDGTLRIKIGDFGVSKHIPIDGSTYLRTEVGTASYMAPEVIGSQYTCTVDCFSLGCLVYRLIAGNDLFQNVQEIYQFAFQGIPSPRSALLEWGLCTNDCADIVGKLITARPEGRLDAVAALNHPWMFRFSTTALLHNKVVSWGESLSQNESPGYLISPRTVSTEKY
ncbi:kinase-like domain-containing protein [Tirmania nivea]|nr:kinase-like domain-containing protein [Tirmania nivea]